jgi:hypothetical protein
VERVPALVKEKTRMKVGVNLSVGLDELSGEQSEEHSNELLKFEVANGECLMLNRKHRPSDKVAQCRVWRATHACT